MDSERLVKLNPDQCKGCYLCLDICPNHLLVVDNSPNKRGNYPAKILDNPYCLNCMKCVNICPDGAFIKPDQPHVNLAGLLYWASLTYHRLVQKKLHS